LLAAGLFGLAISALGIAHQLLPRQFTVAQRQEIMMWQLTRRWRALPAGTIFPPDVRYVISAADIDASKSLLLDARRLGIAGTTSCSAGVTEKAARILARHGCSAVLRATYVDSSGSLVATVAVAVLSDTAQASLAAAELTGPSGSNPVLARSLRVAGTAAAGFRDPQRQLALDSSEGPYVIMSVTGFADGRRRVHVAADSYLEHEMLSLVQGLSGAAAWRLGHPPLVPVCPGAPGC
jgi:hypothetical protein